MRRIYLLFLALIFILAACSNAPSATVEPALALEQHYEGSMVDGSTVSINYPVDWGIQVTVPDYGVIFAFPENLIDSIAAGTSHNFEAGQIEVFVTFSAKAQLEQSLKDVSAKGMLESLLSNVDASAGKVGTIESKTISGRDAATVLLSESSGDSYAVAIDVGDALSVVTGSFASGTLSQYQATMEAMAASISYTKEATAEATETSG